MKSARAKPSFYPKLLPFPMVLGSLPFSREAALQAACLSTGSRESIANEGSESLIQWA